ncbi:MAG: tRNA (adenosine(37)-N6)-dimethylallyltransferase MiaA [Alphaproteobacteria bacterium]|nr:tRNA (adenosine(37)-N6)-dimethylallyltransferase MiaA [Alphaproteobacteria bacterium]
MTDKASQPVLVVAGPTASGKSALALLAAEAFGGVIVNADALQMYAGLRVLSARPSLSEEERVSHRLYGVLADDEICSAARWAKLAAGEIGRAHETGKLPILTGGTGLYLKALIEGLAPMPEVPEPYRNSARLLAAEIGAQALHARLAQSDPVMAARLRPTDTQRVTRAWEVLSATGRSLADWQAMKGKPYPARFVSIFVMPERDELYRSCDARFLSILETGALDEARRYLKAPDDLPVLRALGLKELIRHLKGELSRDEATKLAQAATRHYAKRQVTWFRHQMQPSHALNAQFSESLWPKIFPIIRGFLLTG